MKLKREQLKEIAKEKAKKDINSFEVLDEFTSEWDFDEIKEIPYET